MVNKTSQTNKQNKPRISYWPFKCDLIKAVINLIMDSIAKLININYH